MSGPAQPREADGERGSASRVLVITGPSGVGKGTLIQALRRHFPDLELSVSATTRAPRSGERDGRDYHFMDADEFERRVGRGEFLEHAEYAGNRYGTLRSELERAKDGLVLEIEVQGARQVREALPEAVQVFIAPPSPEVLRERLLRRGTPTSPIRLNLYDAPHARRQSIERLVSTSRERFGRPRSDVEARIHRYLAA